MNIYEFLHENEIVIFITKKELRITIIIMLQRITTEIALESTLPRLVYNDYNKAMVSW